MSRLVSRRAMTVFESNLLACFGGLCGCHAGLFADGRRRADTHGCLGLRATTQATVEQLLESLGVRVGCEAVLAELAQTLAALV